jgi:hypothetical protein
MIQRFSSGAERRQHPRVEKNVPLKISTAEVDLVTETKNLSRTGVYCRVNKFIEPMTKLKIHLLLPVKRGTKTTTKKITCSGVIVRTETITPNSEYSVAIYFNDLPSRDADSITDYINTFLKTEKTVA